MIVVSKMVEFRWLTIPALIAAFALALNAQQEDQVDYVNQTTQRLPGE